MARVVAINGSPRKDHGNTGALLTAVLDGMGDEKWEREVIHASGLDVRPCTGSMRCWYREPGRCYIDDAMQGIYPRVAAAEILILATPVYVPLPGDLQRVINRICPFLVPELVTKEGRTRARFRDHVKIRTIALVATGGWWELGNFEVVVQIAEELARNASVAYAGSLLRPHAGVMGRGESLTEDGRAVLEAARRAGSELATRGEFSSETLEAVSRPLVSREEYLRQMNEAIPVEG
jgi:multimeric flavodoxin WrbA